MNDFSQGQEMTVKNLKKTPHVIKDATGAMGEGEPVKSARMRLACAIIQ
jgi:hypothetical protein